MTVLQVVNLRIDGRSRRRNGQKYSVENVYRGLGVCGVVIQKQAGAAEDLLKNTDTKPHQLKIEFGYSESSLENDDNDANKPESGLNVDEWVHRTDLSTCTGPVLQRYSTASNVTSGSPAALISLIKHRADNPDGNYIHTVVEICGAGRKTPREFNYASE